MTNSPFNRKMLHKMNTIGVSNIGSKNHETFTQSIHSQKILNGGPCKQHARKINLYRNASPGIWCESRKEMTKVKETENPFFRNLTIGGEVDVENKSEQSRFKQRRQQFERDLEVKVRVSKVKRAASHQITRNRRESKDVKIERARRSPRFLNKKKKDSRSSSKKRHKIGEFTSLSPKIKRRFGSVTVGRVVGKREISQKIRKSSNIAETGKSDMQIPLRK